MKLTKGKHIGNYTCPQCRASGGDTNGDNLSIYLDEETLEYNGWCWKCGDDSGYFSGHEFQIYANNTIDSYVPTEQPVINNLSIDVINGYKSIAIFERRISKDTTSFYGVKSDTFEDIEIKRYYPVVQSQSILGYKCRLLPKEFNPTKGATHVGIITQEEFFGQHLFTKGNGTLIITCGEEDAMAAYQMTKLQSKHKKIGYASVSAPGCTHIVRLTKKNLDWISKFERVVFAVDQEESDINAAIEACKLLQPGKGHIAKFEENDASDMCSKGKDYEFYNAIWNADVWKPDGIVLGAETWDIYKNKTFKLKGVQFPEYMGFGDNYPGMVLGCVDVIGAFEKAGKSTLVKELVLHLRQETNDAIGMFMLEEYLEETIDDLIKMKLLGQMEDDTKTKAAWEDIFGDNRIVFSTAHSFLNLEALFIKIRYMAINCGMKYLFVDNLTKLMRMMVDVRDNENFIISQIVTGLDMLARDLGIYICLISHVRKEDGYGKSFSEGKVMKVHDLYGSGDISKFAHNVIAISRNNAIEPNETQYHLIASRRGKLCKSNILTYNHNTYRMEILEAN